MQGLGRGLGANKLDALWITHQHSDHIGGAEDVLTMFGALYVDNGLDLDKTAATQDARTAATTAKATINVIARTTGASPTSPTNSTCLSSPSMAGCVAAGLTPAASMVSGSLPPIAKSVGVCGECVGLTPAC